MENVFNDIPINKEVTYFARTNFRGENKIFGVKRKDRRQHMYILGKSGTGKSALMSNLIIQNIWNGEGVCLVDPHGELVEGVLKMIPPNRIQDVVYFNPADTDFCIGFNPLELNDPKYKHLVASGLMGIFTKIWANVWSPRMEYIMNNTILALLDTPGSTLLGITRMLVDKDYRQIIIENLKDPMVKGFWVHEFEQWKEQFRNEAIAPIQNKVGQFLSSSIIRNIIGQQTSTIDIFELMNKGKILLVNVSKGRIGEDNSRLLGAMIITKLQLAAMERVRIPEEERKDFYLYVDEFQNFATDSFANILSEARKYRLCLTLAHQYTAQIEGGDNDLKDAVFGNVGSMIIFRIGAEDAKIFEKEFAPEFVPEDFIGLPNYQVYLKLMIDGITSRPFSANTLPPIKIELQHDSTESVIDASRKNFCKPIDKVESAILLWSSTSGSANTRIVANGEQVKMYSAVCLNCQKEISIPFEPKEGRPVYCKDCLNKIKIGEVKPARGFYDKNQEKGKPKPAESLASLGIEYESNFLVQDKPVFKKFERTNSTFNKEKTPFRKPNQIDMIKDQKLKEKPKDDFVSLKDFVSKIIKPNNKDKKEDVRNETKNDLANKDNISLNTKALDNLKKNETEKLPEPKPQILNPKAASYESQQKLKNLILEKTEEIKTLVEEKPKEFVPIVEQKVIQDQIQPQTPKDTDKNEVTNQKKDEHHEIPQPPVGYQKKNPKKEIPEHVLKKIFNANDKDTENKEDDDYKNTI